MVCSNYDTIRPKSGALCLLVSAVGTILTFASLVFLIRPPNPPVIVRQGGGHPKDAFRSGAHRHSQQRQPDAGLHLAPPPGKPAFEDKLVAIRVR